MNRSYYLYYVLVSVGIVSIAVCDTPAGRYQFNAWDGEAIGTILLGRNNEWKTYV